MKQFPALINNGWSLILEDPRYFIHRPEDLEGRFWELKPRELLAELGIELTKLLIFPRDIPLAINEQEFDLIFGEWLVVIGFPDDGLIDCYL